MENRSYPAIYRIMHWSIAICMTLLLLTIFLRLTWMNRENVADIIQKFFTAANQSIPRDEAVTLAKQIRKPMWDWHIYLGYAMVGLYTIRMFLPLFGKMRFSNPRNRSVPLKARFQYWLYLAFYVLVGASLVTGLIIKFGPAEFKKPTEEVHALSVYYLVAFMILHIGGVLLAEFTDQKGIISRIISGRKKSQGSRSEVPVRTPERAGL